MIPGEAATCSKEQLLLLLSEARAKLLEAEQKVSDLQISVAEQQEQLDKQSDLLEEKERRIRSFARKAVLMERQLQDYRNENVTGYDSEGDENDCEDNDNVVDVPVPVIAKQGCPKKDWDKLGQESKRKESQKILLELQKTAENRNVDPVQLAGTILHRSEYLQFIYF